MKIRLSKVSIDGLNWTPTEEDGGKLVLVVTAPMLYKLACTLRCEGLCFTGDGHPRRFEGKVGLDLSIDKSSVELGDRIYEAQKIVKFKVGREKEAADSDPTLHVTMRMHFDGGYLELQEFCRSMNKGTFSCIINPAQQDLFGDPDDEPAEEKKDKKGEPALASAAEMKRKEKVQ